MLSKSISAIAKRVSSGLTPLRSNPDFWMNGTVPWLKTEQLGEKFIYSTKENISEVALKKTSIKVYPPNTLSIAMYGEGKTRGNVSIIKSKMATNQACCNIELDPELADSEYVYYFLKTQYNELRNLSSGVRKNLNSEDIKRFVVRLPEDLDDQKKIAAVLSVLDAKIDCNNRINAELEAMAKTLYDYWFVQFDFPDASGKPYKSSGGKMVYNTTLKRDIPTDWGVLKLSDLVDLIKGNISPADLSKDTPYVGLEHIGRRKIALTDWASSDLAASDKTIFKKDDILFGKIRPYFHKVTVAPFDGITSTDTIILRPKRKNYSGFALETVFADEFIDAATQSSTGSKMPRADWNVLRNYTVPGPTTDLLDVFNAVYENAIKKIQLSGLENRKLTELRDWLLPLLMNGQVTVA
jgi:type I restriction enzyme, S subunit